MAYLIDFVDISVAVMATGSFFRSLPRRSLGSVTCKKLQCDTLRTRSWAVWSARKILRGGYLSATVRKSLRTDKRGIYAGHMGKTSCPQFAPLTRTRRGIFCEGGYLRTVSILPLNLSEISRLSVRKSLRTVADRYLENHKSFGK